MAQKLKVLVVGPCKAGKTAVCNFLGEQTESLVVDMEKYNPTVGTRILECEYKLPGGRRAMGGADALSVELWDCSGNQQYESCWPAIQQDAKGVMIVYNPDDKAQEREAEMWHEWFVRQPRLAERRCLLLAHRLSHGPRTIAPEGLRGSMLADTNYEDPAHLKAEFVRFLGVLVEQAAAAAAAAPSGK